MSQLAFEFIDHTSAFLFSSSASASEYSMSRTSSFPESSSEPALSRRELLNSRQHGTMILHEKPQHTQEFTTGWGTSNHINKMLMLQASFPRKVGGYWNFQIKTFSPFPNLSEQQLRKVILDYRIHFSILSLILSQKGTMAMTAG